MEAFHEDMKWDFRRDLLDYEYRVAFKVL